LVLITRRSHVQHSTPGFSGGAAAAFAAGDPTFMNNVAGNPTDVLATNFSKPAALFEKFPHQRVFIADKDGSK
jgi:hypothetical protein